jgi:Asp/Glu/hydantoin racemase
MRLIALTPAHVGEAEILRRAARYTAFAGSAFPVLVLDQPDRPEVPHSFDTAELIAAADECVMQRALGLELDEDDIVMPDCILDTALPRLSEALTNQTHGILRLNTSFFASLGLRFGAVARNEAVGTALHKTIEAYDSSDRYIGTQILNLPTEAVADTVRWNSTLSDHVQELADLGAQVVINGCSAVDVEDAQWAIPVVDPTMLAIRCLTLARGVGLFPAQEVV